MGCNCKNKNGNKNTVDYFEVLKEKHPFMGKLILYFGKVILFLISTVLVTLVVLPISMYICFKVSFINNELDFTKNIFKLIKQFKYVKNDDDDDYSDEDEDNNIDDENFDYSNIELLNNEKVK